VTAKKERFVIKPITFHIKAGTLLQKQERFVIMPITFHVKSWNVTAKTGTFCYNAEYLPYKKMERCC